MKWLWKWTLRAGMTLLALALVLYVFVLVRSMIPVPVHDAGLQLPRATIPAGANTFDVLTAAADQMWWPEERQLDFKTNLLSATNWDEALAVEVLGKNQAALTNWDAAVALKDFQVPDFKMSDDLNYFQDWKKLSSLSVVRAKHLLNQDQSQAALETLLAHVRLGQKMGDAHGAIIHYLVSLSISSQALAAVRQSLTSTNFNPAQLKDCAAKLGLLADGESGAWSNTVKSEYQSMLQVLDDLRHGRITDSQTGSPLMREHWFNPAINYSKTKALFADAAQMLVSDAARHYNEIKTPDLSHRPSILHLVFSGNFAGEVIYFMTLPAGAAVLDKKSRSDAQLQATRTLLALRAYQLTHAKLPDNLSALVPEFLDKVPVDDFDGQPLRYSPEKKLVYSVGKNLKDDGGDDRGQEEWNPAERHLDTAFHFEF